MNKNKTHELIFLIYKLNQIKQIKKSCLKIYVILKFETKTVNYF